MRARRWLDRVNANSAEKKPLKRRAPKLLLIKDVLDAGSKNLLQDSPFKPVKPLKKNPPH